MNGQITKTKESTTQESQQSKHSKMYIISEWKPGVIVLDPENAQEFYLDTKAKLLSLIQRMITVNAELTTIISYLYSDWHFAFPIEFGIDRGPFVISSSYPSPMDTHHNYDSYNDRSRWDKIRCFIVPVIQEELSLYDIDLIFDVMTINSALLQSHFEYDKTPPFYIWMGRVMREACAINNKQSVC